MRTLITSNVLNKFIDTISEKEYQTAWEKVEAYRAEEALIRTRGEKTFQSEFFAKIFDDVLGYKTSAKHSLKSSNLLVEHKNPTNGEQTDGVVIDKNADVKIVIELKSVKDTTGAALRNKKRGGSDGKTPMQQAAVYLFQFPKAELAIVSNFDSVIVFNKKEAYTQEWSLFDMDYNEFKEFYLILNSESFFNGLTHMMIGQSAEAEKPIDDEFFVKVGSLHKILNNKYKPEYAADLFNKFMAMAILEDNGRLPTNLINTVHSRKDDFDHSDTHWGVWTKFFQAMKKHQAGREYLGINPEVAQLPLWQNVSYLGRIKVPKSTLDLVVEISKYDLFSIPMDRLFFTMNYWIHNAHQGVFNYSDEPDNNVFLFDFYSDLLKEKGTPIDVCLAFTCGRFDGQHHMIDLFEQVSPYRINPGIPNDKLFTIDYSYTAGSDWFSIIDKSDLEEPSTVSEFIKHLYSVQLMTLGDNDYAMIGSTFPATPIFHVHDGEHSYEVEKKTINDRIIILTAEDKEWLATYEKGAQTVGSFCAVTTENDAAANMYFEIENAKVVTRDEMGNWFNAGHDWFDDEKIYINSHFADLGVILKSSDFLKWLRLREPKDFSGALISQHLLSDDFLGAARELKEIRETIYLYEHKLDKLKDAGASEKEIMKIELQLDNLYDQEKGLI